MRGPLQERVVRPGGLADVYPLAIPAGEGLDIPLGPIGTIGFRNDDGQLVLTVAPQSEQRLRQALGDDLVHREDVRGEGGSPAVDC